MILSYGRGIKADPDPWQTSVSAKNFDMQLDVLAGEWKVIGLKQLFTDTEVRKWSKKTIALSFESGYEDDFTVIKPLLEKYKLPATFFLTTDVIHSKEIYWFDELERLILFSRHLPPVVRVSFPDETFSFEVARETVLTDNIKKQYSSWNAAEKPVNLRTEFYMLLREKMKYLPEEIRTEILAQIKDQASIIQREKQLYALLNKAQVAEINNNPLFDIGLKSNWTEQQGISFREFLINEKKEIEESIRSPVHFLSFNLNNLSEEEFSIVAETGFSAALINKELKIGRKTRPIGAGKFPVRDYNLYAFRKVLNKWKNSVSA